MSEKELRTWTPDFSLKYFQAHPNDVYLKKLDERFNKLDVNGYVNMFFPNEEDIKMVVDIGGGKLGGAA